VLSLAEHSFISISPRFCPCSLSSFFKRVPLPSFNEQIEAPSSLPTTESAPSVSHRTFVATPVPVVPMRACPRLFEVLLTVLTHDHSHNEDGAPLTPSIISLIARYTCSQVVRIGGRASDDDSSRVTKMVQVWCNDSHHNMNGNRWYHWFDTKVPREGHLAAVINDHLYLGDCCFLGVAGIRL
jgi:hypothetical protein